MRELSLPHARVVAVGSLEIDIAHVRHAPRAPGVARVAVRFFGTCRNLRVRLVSVILLVLRVVSMLVGLGLIIALSAAVGWLLVVLRKRRK